MSTRLKAAAAGLLILLGSGFQQSNANAQITQSALDTGLSVIGKMTVGSVLQQIEGSVQNIGLMVNNDANLDMGNAFITLQSGLQQVVYQLDKQRSKVVNDLDTQRKDALLDVYVLSNDLLQKNIPFDQAKLKVDTLTVLNHVRILGKQTPFMIAYIDPTVITYKDIGDYSVQITGMGIGNHEGKQLPTKVILIPSDGPQVTVPISDLTDGITFTIPRSFVQNRFGDTSLSRMRVKIQSTAPTACGPVSLFMCQRPYEFQYSMVLFPKQAAAGAVLQIRTTPSTDPNTRVAKLTTTITPNGDGNHYQTWATPAVAADPGYTITSIEWTGKGNEWNKPGDPCAFVYPDPRSEIPQNMGAAAQITGTNNSWPCRVTFTVWEEKQIALSDPLPPFPISFSAGESKTVNVAGDAVSILMNLSLANGDKTTIQLQPAGGLATDAVVCTGRIDIGGGVAQYLCKAKDVSYF